MKTTNRTYEINMIAYRVPNTDWMLVDRINEDEFLCKRLTCKFTAIYSKAEVLEVIGLDIDNSKLERLGWIA